MIKNRATPSHSKNQHNFAVAQSGITRERSSIDRPSRTTTTMDAGWLYPILIDEVLPGDTFQLRCQTKGWLATPLVPFLDNLYLDTFFFFVPNRLVWENWQKFQGEKDNPGDSTSYVVPQIEIAGGSTAGAGKLADYMGIPTVATTLEVNAMPFRGYNLIYNEYFRDQNLQDSLVVDIDDADSDEADYILKRRGKRKDYLTGCLPWPQRGDVQPGVISGTVPVISDGLNLRLEDQSGNESDIQFAAGGVSQTNVPDSVDFSENIIWGSQSGLVADLDTAQANTINQLRLSISIQQLLELDARGGTRYVEQLKARFGVTSADARLQRPEYLGGGSNNISVTPVPGTNQGPTPSALGQLGGFGHIDASGGGFTHSFVEHGFVIGLATIRADLTYFEGLPRQWSRLTRYDYYEPSLAHLGEQAVYNQEIFVSNVDADDRGTLAVFGYQERFAEYKYGNSMVTSFVRPNHPIPLSFWTLAQQFSTAPTLGDSFIQENPPVDRVIGVPSQPHLIVDCYFQNKCTRVMPVFNTPGLTRL